MLLKNIISPHIRLNLNIPKTQRFSKLIFTGDVLVRNSFSTKFYASHLTINIPLYLKFNFFQAFVKCKWVVKAVIIRAIFLQFIRYFEIMVYFGMLVANNFLKNIPGIWVKLLKNALFFYLNFLLLNWFSKKGTIIGYMSALKFLRRI